MAFPPFGVSHCGAIASRTEAWSLQITREAPGPCGNTLSARLDANSRSSPPTLPRTLRMEFRRPCFTSHPNHSTPIPTRTRARPARVTTGSSPPPPSYEHRLGGGTISRTSTDHAGLLHVPGLPGCPTRIRLGTAVVTRPPLNDPIRVVREHGLRGHPLVRARGAGAGLGLRPN